MDSSASETTPERLATQSEATPRVHAEASPPKVSVVMPCLNESLTLEVCIKKAQGALEPLGIPYEIVIADNGSTDGSQAIAAKAGARVVPVTARGYGSALMGGFAAARGEYLMMADSDDSYDLAGLAPFVAKLDEGFDLVMGNRFKGGIAPGAMPPLHRYLGNPVLTGILNLFFRTGIGDAHCGLRGFRKDLLERIQLVTTGMEFASEMVIKASEAGVRICEVPTTLQPDGRDRAPHLRSWRDGWRHLRFMLLHAPNWAFIVPGAVMATVGLVAAAVLGFTEIRLGDTVLTYNSMIFAGALGIVGYQVLWLGVSARIYAETHFFGRDRDDLAPFFRSFTLEKPLVIGGLLLILGLALMGITVASWISSDLGGLHTDLIKASLGGTLMILIGLQTIFGSLLAGMMLIRHRRPDTPSAAVSGDA